MRRRGRGGRGSRDGISGDAAGEGAVTAPGVTLPGFKVVLGVVTLLSLNSSYTLRTFHARKSARHTW